MEIHSGLSSLAQNIMDCNNEINECQRSQIIPAIAEPAGTTRSKEQTFEQWLKKAIVQLLCRWVCFFIRTDFREMKHCITCSPVDPLLWMGAVRMRAQTADKSTHNKSIIKTFWLQTTALTLKKSFIHNIAFSCEKVVLSESGENYTVFIFKQKTVQNRSKHMSVNYDVRGQCYYERKRYYGLWTLIGALELCGLLVDYCDVFIRCSDSHSDGTHSLQRVTY